MFGTLGIPISFLPEKNMWFSLNLQEKNMAFYNFLFVYFVCIFLDQHLSLFVLEQNLDSYLTVWNFFLFRLTTCPVGSDWNSIVSSRVFCNWQTCNDLLDEQFSVFFLAPAKYKSLEFDFEFNILTPFLSHCWCVFVCFNNLISSLGCLISCWFYLELVISC